MTARWHTSAPLFDTPYVLRKISHRGQQAHLKRPSTLPREVARNRTNPAVLAPVPTLDEMVRWQSIASHRDKAFSESINIPFYSTCNIQGERSLAGVQPSQATLHFAGEFIPRFGIYPATPSWEPRLFFLATPLNLPQEPYRRQRTVGLRDTDEPIDASLSHDQASLPRPSNSSRARAATTHPIGIDPRGAYRPDRSSTHYCARPAGVHRNEPHMLE